jgi:hypothetical protein
VKNVTLNVAVFFYLSDQPAEAVLIIVYSDLGKIFCFMKSAESTLFVDGVCVGGGGFF